MPKLIHPDSDLTIEPDADHADNFKTQGWVEKPKPKVESKGK